MAKYKITDRRKKAGGSNPNALKAELPKIPETPNVSDASQAAAFALYEEFFGKQPPENDPPAEQPQDLFEPMPVDKDEYLASDAAAEGSVRPPEENEVPVIEFGQEKPEKNEVLDDQISIEDLSSAASAEDLSSAAAAEDLQIAAEMQDRFADLIAQDESAETAPEEAQTAQPLRETSDEEATPEPVAEDPSLQAPDPSGALVEHPDLINPESVEPTREFSVEDVRRAMHDAPEPVSDAAPAEPQSAAPDMSALFADMFGAPAPAASRKSAAKKSSAARREDEDPQPTVTRAAIGDLVADGAAGVIVPESDAGLPLQEEESGLPEDEFVSSEQADGVLERFRLTLSSLRREVAGLVILFLMSFYLESACFSSAISLPRPEFLTPGKYGLVFLLLDLQLLLLTAVIGRRQFANGCGGIFSGKANVDAVPFTAALCSLIELAYLIGFARTQTGYLLFGCVTVFIFLLAAIRDILEIKADMMALGVLIDSKQLFAAAKLPEGNAETEEFAEYLNGETPEVFSVNRTRFVDGFLDRVSRRAPGSAMFTVGIPLVFLLSAGIAVWCYLGGRDPMKAFSAFAAAAMMGLPSCSLFAFTVPFYCAQKRARRNATALIGQNSVEECGNAEILSFDDTEVFLPKHVKVTSVRTYGAARIDKILIYCAQIFNVIGGPLSFVFQNSISSLENALHAPIEILENNGDGICAGIEGRIVRVGGADYMEAHEIAVECESSDKTYENTVGRIMYLAIDDEISAKFYIKYAVSARFEQQLRALNRAGIYAVIRTCDPNIDKALLEKILRTAGNPIGVLRTGDAAQNTPPAERLSAPIVSGGKRSGILNAFLLCDAVRSRSAANTLVKFVSMLLGLVIAFALTYMTGTINPLVCFVYQLLWIVPVIIPSLFDWPSVPRGKKRK